MKHSSLWRVLRSCQFYPLGSTNARAVESRELGGNGLQHQAMACWAAMVPAYSRATMHQLAASEKRPISVVLLAGSA